MVEGRKTNKKTVKPGKDISGSIVEDLRLKLLKLINKDVNELAIDMKGVNMIDSTGLGVLIAARNSLDKAGGLLRLTNVSENIDNLFKMMGIDRYLNTDGV
ncbi:MAG: STAS domain-containing protein [Desulfatiglans sp.]|jgi:anti-sigma B factor antagonist|nr:STAS domain-containing protein [Desulfatiglans sp.]